MLPLGAHLFVGWTTADGTFFRLTAAADLEHVPTRLLVRGAGLAHVHASGGVALLILRAGPHELAAVRIDASGAATSLPFRGVAAP